MPGDGPAVRDAPRRTNRVAASGRDAFDSLVTHQSRHEPPGTRDCSGSVRAGGHWRVPCPRSTSRTPLPCFSSVIHQSSGRWATCLYYVAMVVAIRPPHPRESLTARAHALGLGRPRWLEMFALFESTLAVSARVRDAGLLRESNRTRGATARGEQIFAAANMIALPSRALLLAPWTPTRLALARVFLPSRVQMTNHWRGVVHAWAVQ